MENIKALIIFIVLVSSALIVVFSQNSNQQTTVNTNNGIIETSQYSGGVLFENYTQANTGVSIYIVTYANINDTVNRTLHVSGAGNYHFFNANSASDTVFTGVATTTLPQYNVSYVIPSEAVNYELSKETQSNLSSFYPNLYVYMNMTEIFSNAVIKVSEIAETFSHYGVGFGTYGTEYPTVVYENDTFTSLFNRNPAGYNGEPQITPLQGIINQNPNPLYYDSYSFQDGKNWTYVNYSVDLSYSILNYQSSTLYPVTFYANETNVSGFYLMVVSQSSFNAYFNFTSIDNKYVLDFPNGTFFYNVVLIKYKDVAGINVTYYVHVNNQYFSIHGSGIDVNVGLLQTNNVNLSQFYFYLFIAVTVITIGIVLKIGDGYLMPSVLTLNLFLFLGFELNIEYFTSSVIASFMTLIIGYFVYDAVMK